MERLKNMGLKKSFFFLSVWCILLSLVLVLLVFFICSTIKSGYPPVRQPRRIRHPPPSGGGVSKIRFEEPTLKTYLRRLRGGAPKVRSAEDNTAKRCADACESMPFEELRAGVTPVL